MKVKEKVPQKIQGNPNQKKPAKKSEKQNVGKWIWLSLAFVIITTIIIYVKAISFNLLYYWDDNYYISGNEHIKDLHWENIKLIFSNFYASNYQPVTMLFYALEYKIANGRDAIFHFVNILLHLINTVLVFVLIRKISPKNAFVAIITAAFFAVHPMHVESVAWVAERKDVLYTFFFLSSLIYYTNYLKSEKPSHLLLAGILFLLSCLSKSAAVILPLVLLLFDYYCGRKFSLKWIVEKIPFFAISLIFGIVAIYSQKSSGVLENWAPEMSFIEHGSIVSYSFINYLYKVLIPLNLSAIYPYPKEIGTTLPFIYYLSILIVGLVLFFVWYSRRWGKDIIFGFLFFVITIILVLQIIPVGTAIMADRYVYVPYIGMFFIIGKLYERMSLRMKANYQKYSLVVFFSCFFVFSALSFERVKKWENDETLFSDVIEKYPNCTNAYLNRGNYYNAYYAKKVFADDKTKSDTYIRKAVSDFDNALQYELIEKNKWVTYFNLGLAKGDLSDYEGAVKSFDKSIELKPSRYAYLMRGAHYLNYFANTAFVNDSVKRVMYINKSIYDFENSLKLASEPEDKIQLYQNIGTAKLYLGDYAGAISNYDKIIEIDAKYTLAYVKRSDARYQLKNYEGALEDCNKAIELNPQDINTIKNRDVVKSILKNSKK